MLFDVKFQATGIIFTGVFLFWIMKKFKCFTCWIVRICEGKIFEQSLVSVEELLVDLPFHVFLVDLLDVVFGVWTTAKPFVALSASVNKTSDVITASLALERESLLQTYLWNPTYELQVTFQGTQLLQPTVGGVENCFKWLAWSTHDSPELQVLEMFDSVVVFQFVEGGVPPVALWTGELLVVHSLDV